jgi:hypothetical protein
LLIRFGRRTGRASDRRYHTQAYERTSHVLSFPVRRVVQDARHRRSTADRFGSWRDVDGNAREQAATFRQSDETS